MTSKALRVLLVAAVALAAVGALAGGAAAATDTLAGDGSDEIQDFNASSADHVTYELSSEGTDFGTDGSDVVHLNMTVDDEHVAVSNDSIATDDTSYTFNLSQSEMATTPGDAGGNTTVTVNAWGEDSDTDTVNTSVQSFDADLQFTDDYAVVYAGDSAVDGDASGVDLSTETVETWFGFGDNETSSTLEADSVGLGQNASGTTVHVIMANGSTDDAFSQAAEAGFLSSIDTESFVPSHQLLLAGHQHAVFYEGAPVDELADGYTYAETTDRGGHNAYTVHVDDDYEDESSLDVEAHANDGLRFDEELSVKADAFGGWFSGLTAGSNLFGFVGA